MPGETVPSPETVAALPEPAVGVEYPSGEAAKVAVFRYFRECAVDSPCPSKLHID